MKQIYEEINALMGIETGPIGRPARIKKAGVWIRQGSETNLKCPFCRKRVKLPKGELYFYCPNCGADMRPTYSKKPQQEIIVINDEFVE